MQVALKNHTVVKNGVCSIPLYLFTDYLVTRPLHVITVAVYNHRVC